MVTVRVYVEGGGDSRALRSRCREAFSTFFARAGLVGRMPAVIACGTRRAAFEGFCTSVASNATDLAVLLVDSEETVSATAWTHLRNRDEDGWKKPDGVTDDQAHLMVQCMEAWFLADREWLAEFFGVKFAKNSLPKSKNVETIEKIVILDKLKTASKHTRKGTYDKGKHSFEILKGVDPSKVAAASKHARQLLEMLKVKCG